MAGPMGPGGRRGANDRAKNFGQTSKRLLAEFKPLLAKFIVVAFFVVLGAVLTIISPILIKNILSDMAELMTFGLTISVN